MAKGSIKSFWSDKKREGERLQKISAKKKPSGAADGAGPKEENTSELKPEDKQE